MTETTLAPLDVSPVKQFFTGHQWIGKVQQQFNTALLEDADEVTLELYYYIARRMQRTPDWKKQCVIKLVEFQKYAAKRFGVAPSACVVAWSRLDWRHAL